MYILSGIDGIYNGHNTMYRFNDNNITHEFISSDFQMFQDDVIFFAFNIDLNINVKFIGDLKLDEYITFILNNNNSDIILDFGYSNRGSILDV